MTELDVERWAVVRCAGCGAQVIEGIARGEAQRFDPAIETVLMGGQKGPWKMAELRKKHVCKELGPEAELCEEEDVMPQIGGKSFCCDCGGNVFRRHRQNSMRFRCNSCAAWYVGEST